MFSDLAVVEKSLLVSEWLKRDTTNWFCTMCLHLQWSQHISRELFIPSRNVTIWIWANGSLFFWQPTWNRNKYCNLLVLQFSIFWNCSIVHLWRLSRFSFFENKLWDQSIYRWENKGAEIYLIAAYINIKVYLVNS